MALLVVNDSVLAQLEVLIAPGSYLYGAKVALYQSDTEVAADSVLADFDIADFPGYEDFGPLDWGAAQLDEDQASSESIAPAVFAPSDGTDQTIYGWLLLTEGGDLVGGERFAKPKRVMVTNDTIEFNVTYTVISQL